MTFIIVIAQNSTVCMNCLPADDSSSGSSRCALAAEGYFLNPSNTKSEPCPEGASCYGQEDVPRPKRVRFCIACQL